MKRTYEKPMVAVERYELTQTIASCSMKIGFLNSTCVLKDSDATGDMKNLAASGYFSAGECTKSYNTGEDITNDGICYHTNVNSAFNS